MKAHRFAFAFGAAGLLGCALPIAAPSAMAAPNVQAPGADFAAAPAEATVQDIAVPQTYQVEQSDGGAAQIDPRAKAAWLTECRRRANINGATAANAGAYDYCEAYLDDYYRSHSQATADNSIVYQNQALPQPAQLARTDAVQQPYEEIITEEYVPVRSIARRSVPRVVRDKRIKLYPH